MNLADTTIWIDHFRSQNAEMHRQLETKNIAMHPFIVAELALGSLRERAKTLAWLDFLPRVRIAHIGEVRQMIELKSLHSKGILFTDAHLIASCLIDPPTLLWTNDQRLSKVAKWLGVAASIP